MSYANVALLATNPNRERNILFSAIYTGINAAVNGVPDDTLLLVDPGDYVTNAPLDINKRLAIVGLDTRPRIINQNVYEHHNTIIGGADVVFENMVFRSNTMPWITALYITQDNPNIRLLAHRCHFQVGHSSGYGFASRMTAPPGALRLHHCTIERGYSTLLHGNLSAIDLHRCYTPNYSTYLTSGALNLDDKVLTPTDGYGSDSGEPLIDLNHSLVNISSRVMDLRGIGSPHVVLFGWANPASFCVPSQIDADGHWSDAFVPRGHEFGIYYLSRDNRCPPIIHGPYTAE